MLIPNKVIVRIVLAHKRVIVRIVFAHKRVIIRIVLTNKNGECLYSDDKEKW